VRYIRIRFYSAFCPLSSSSVSSSNDSNKKSENKNSDEKSEINTPPLIIGKVAVFGVPLVSASNSLLKFSPPFFFHYYSKNFESSYENENAKSNFYSSPKTLKEYYEEISNSEFLPTSPTSITKYNSSFYPSKKIRGCFFELGKNRHISYKLKIYHSNCFIYYLLLLLFI
jgi:hypothetical protein